MRLAVGKCRCIAGQSGQRTFSSSIRHDAKTRGKRFSASSPGKSFCETFTQAHETCAKHSHSSPTSPSRVKSADRAGSALPILEAMTPGTTPERKAEIERQLLAYCKLDTLAMVRLWEFFRGKPFH